MYVHTHAVLLMSMACAVLTLCMALHFRSSWYSLRSAQHRGAYARAPGTESCTSRMLAGASSVHALPAQRSKHSTAKFAPLPMASRFLPLKPSLPALSALLQVALDGPDQVGHWIVCWCVHVKCNYVPQTKHV